MSDPMPTLLVEYPCERRCQVEFDLTDVQVRFNKNQMLTYCDSAHEAAHKLDPPVKVWAYAQDVTVKAGVL